MKDNPFNKKPTSKTGRKSTPKPFDYGAISLADKKALQGYAEQIRSIARKGVEEVFELGECFADAKERLPKRYEEWVRKELVGITPRTTNNYINVWERFGNRREQVVALGLKPSALYKLAGALEPAVDEVLGRAEAGETVRGSDVTQIIRLHADPDDASLVAPSPADRGGSKGLKALLNDSAVHWQREWTVRAFEHLKDLEALVPPGEATFPETMAVVEKTLVAKALWLHVELSRMTGAHFVNRAGDRIGMGYMEGRDWPSEPWKLLYLSLGLVGVSGQTKGRLFKNATELLLRLRWALGKGPLPSAPEDLFLPPENNGSSVAGEADE